MTPDNNSSLLKQNFAKLLVFCLNYQLVLVSLTLNLFKYYQLHQIAL